MGVRKSKVQNETEVHITSGKQIFQGFFKDKLRFPGPLWRPAFYDRLPCVNKVLLTYLLTLRTKIYLVNRHSLTPTPVG